MTFSGRRILFFCEKEELKILYRTPKHKFTKVLAKCLIMVQLSKFKVLQKAGKGFYQQMSIIFKRKMQNSAARSHSCIVDFDN